MRHFHSILCVFITIDESEYASIVKQVHDDEFNKELEARVKMEKEKNEKDIALAKQNEKLEAEKRIKQLEQEIASLNNKISNAENDKKLAISDSNREKEAKISNLEKQITELEGQLKLKDKEAELLKKRDENCNLLKQC